MPATFLILFHNFTRERPGPVFLPEFLSSGGGGASYRTVLHTAAAEPPPEVPPPPPPGRPTDDRANIYKPLLLYDRVLNRGYLCARAGRGANRPTDTNESDPSAADLTGTKWTFTVLAPDQKGPRTQTTFLPFDETFQSLNKFVTCNFENF